MNKRQVDAIKQLEAALQLCKKSGLALVGIDGNLFATIADAAFKTECRAMSSCEAVLNRHNNDHSDTVAIDAHGAYLDSGAA